MLKARGADIVDISLPHTRYALPAYYIVAPAEILGGVALIAGFQTRLVAAATLPLLLGVVTVHSGNGWVFSAPNGGWEFPVYLVVLAVAQVLLGGGAYSFDNWRRN